MELGLLFVFGTPWLLLLRAVRRWEWKFNICNSFTARSLQWLPDLSTVFIFFLFFSPEIKEPLEMVCNMEDTHLYSATVYTAAVWTEKLTIF